MPGIAYFYITSENQVIKVPQPKKDGFKPLTTLANEEVIIVEIAYTTSNRKPISTSLVSFRRVTLDVNGSYRTSDEEISEAVNDLDALYFGASKIAESSDPLEIPRARFIPTNEQKNIIIQYIKKEYPGLYQTVAYKIQEYCDAVVYRNEKKRKLIKEAARIRKSR